MTTQPTLFDLPKAKKLRDAGKDRAATERRELLGVAQEYAVNLCRFLTVPITADEVYDAMAVTERHPERLGNAWGSVFKGPEWEWTGEWRQSTRVSNRGRYIRVWRLRPKKS